MNFGAQRSRFSHLSMALKIFRIKTKQCKILCSPLKGHSPAMRTVDSSGITSSGSTEPFPPPPHVTALLWAPLPTSLWFNPLSCQQSTDVPPASGTGTEGMAPYEQGVCPQPLCPSATAPAPGRWAPTPGALQEQEGTGTWRVMRSAECWMQMCGSQLEIQKGM